MGHRQKVHLPRSDSYSGRREAISTEVVHVIKGGTVEGVNDVAVRVGQMTLERLAIGHPASLTKWSGRDDLGGTNQKVVGTVVQKTVRDETET